MSCWYRPSHQVNNQFIIITIIQHDNPIMININLATRETAEDQAGLANYPVGSDFLHR